MLEQVRGRAGGRATELVGQILTFSRQTEQEMRPVRVQPVLKEALKLLRASLPATISMEQDVQENCGPILADSTQVHQVVMNLCTNAYQAMQSGGGTLTVITERGRQRPIHRRRTGRRPPPSGFLVADYRPTG